MILKETTAITEEQYYDALNIIEKYKEQLALPFKKQIDFLESIYKNWEIQRSVTKNNGFLYCPKEKKKIIVKGDLELYKKEIDKDMFNNVVIHGHVFFRELEYIDKDFLSGTIIHGMLNMHTLKCDFPKGFLRNTLVCGTAWFPDMYDKSLRKVLVSNYRKAKKSLEKAGHESDINFRYQ